MTNITDFLTDNPEYIQILESCVEYEENNKEPDHVFVEDEEYDSHWTYKDVGAHPSKLYKMETDGLLERVFDSNSTTAYSLRNRSEAKAVLDEMEEKFNNGVVEEMHDFPSAKELEEMGIFDDVVGYDDAKWLIRKAMSSDNIVNILLVGPPGCGKTVFLRCIRKLEDTSFISGRKTSEAGFTNEMFEAKPRYMCIDEMDDMSDEHQKALSDYTEEGYIVETKGNDKRREMKTNTKTFASANHLSNIINPIEDRFTVLEFDSYGLNEFVEICINILPREYDVTREESKEIAAAVWDMEGYANVRKAEDVAALSDGDDPKKVLEVLENYSGGSKSKLVNRL